MFLLHLFKCMKVVVRAHQLNQWLHSFGVNSDHLDIAGFNVLDIELVKVLKELDQLLLPRGV